LFNTTQPLIRYEVSDMVTVSPELCPCGLPFRLIAQMDGRSDDIIYLQNQSGREIPVHPVHFHSAIGAIPEISEYQIVHEHDEIRVRVVLRAGACREEVANRLKSKVRSSVESLAALCPDISIEFLERIERDHRSMGKLKLVTSSVPAGGLGH
jgi:phenylacetate-coenzyme A ligase PaaK-like adenylate-forming protein